MRFRRQQEVSELVCDRVAKHDAAIDVISPRELHHPVVQHRGSAAA
jgi:hypothetical protein